MRMRYIGLIVILLCILAGCNKESAEHSSLKPVNPVELKGTLRETFNARMNQNGIYLINTRVKKQYLLLNGSKRIQGESAAYFENVRIEDDKNTANIYFDELYTEDYKDKEPLSVGLYEIITKGTTDTIGIYKNNEQTAIDCVIVIE